MLTEGYAHALRLERELLRLERETEMLSHRAADPDAADRLRRLAPRIRARRQSLDHLRRRLTRLKLLITAQPAQPA